MSSHRFPLLQALPWLNQALLNASGVSELRNNIALQPYGSSITAIIDKLERFENDEEAQSAFKSILFAEPVALIQSRLTNLGSVNAEKLSNLAAILLDYRFLDVIISLQIGASPAGQDSRLPIPLPSKMHFKQLSHWPSLVSRGLRLLRECEHDMPSPDTLNGDPTLSIFSFLLHRKDSIEGHKIMSNFECVVAHLNLILKGVVDFPNNMADFKKLVLEFCPKHDTIPTDRWDAFFASIKTPHSFKLPLHIALACSPICLLFPSCIMTKDLNRLVLLQIWQGLGGHRPEIIQAVEHNLWRGMFEAAVGTAPLHARLEAAFLAIASMDLEDVGYPSSEWLKGDTNFIGMQPKAMNPKKPRPASRDNRPRPDRRTDEVKNVGGLNSASPAARATRSQAAKLNHQPNSEGSSHSQTKLQPANLEGRPSAKPSILKTAKPGLSRGLQTRSDVKGKARAVSESSSSEDDDDEDDEDYTMDTTPARKRTRSTLSTKDSTGPELGVKALKLEDGTRAVRVYEAIDLTFEAVGPPLIDLTLDEHGLQEERFRTPVCVLWDLRSTTMDHVPKFHVQQEADWFTMLFRTTKGCRPGEKPQFLADGDSSFFAVVTLHDLSTGEMQELFRKHIIVTAQNVVADCLFDSESARNFCMLDKVISIRDFSIPLHQDRMTTGTLGQVLLSAESDGKTLAALDVPIPGGVAPLSSLASDVHGWDMTIDQAWCSRRWEMPRSAVRWAEISTINAYRPLSLSPNGFAIQVEVKAGSQLLLVCQPSTFNPHPMSSIAMLERFRSPYSGDTKTFDFQAIHLIAGHTAVIQPLTPFLLLSTNHSIVQMSHFYAMSTIQASCIGFMHSSLTMSASTNSAQKASQALLRRLVHYLHLVYMNEEYVTRPQNFPHIPDVLTTQGVIDVLSLCNIFEAMNLLTHTLTDLDRHLFIEARRLCRRMVAWMQARFTFTDQGARRLDLSKDLWMPYLSHQLKTLRGYQEFLHQRGMNIIDHSTFRGRLDAFEKNHRELRLGSATARAWSRDDFQWPAHSDFTISLRFSPDTVPEDIRGETHDDLSHFGT